MSFKFWVLNLVYVKRLMRNDIKEFLIVGGYKIGIFYILKYFNRGVYDIKGDCFL